MSGFDKRLKKRPGNALITFAFTAQFGASIANTVNTILPVKTHWVICKAMYCTLPSFNVLKYFTVLSWVLCSPGICTHRGCGPPGSAVLLLPVMVVGAQFIFS